MSPEVRKGGFSMDDYVTVAERVVAFYEKYPDGSIQCDIVDLSDDRIVMRATVYRNPGDERPSVAHSSLGIPGSTPYTRGSEIENAETSAAGRAIAMFGFEVKRGMASRDEIRNKADEAPLPPMERTDDGGLIGTVEKGKAPVDMELRQTADGWGWGFKLKAGAKGYQALATGPLAEVLSMAGVAVGVRVAVWGDIELVPWDKAGKPMPPFARIAVTKVQTSEWTLPGDAGATETPEPAEAESVPLFELTEDERALVGGGLP